MSLIYWKAWSLWGKKINPNVTVTEIDKTVYIPDSRNFGLTAPYLSRCQRGPKNPLIFIGPTIERIKWWQFWRYHLIKQYKKEMKESREKFLEIFGQPYTPDENQIKLFNDYLDGKDTSKLYVTRVKE